MVEAHCGRFARSWSPLLRWRMAQRRASSPQTDTLSSKSRCMVRMVSLLTFYVAPPASKPSSPIQTELLALPSAILRLKGDEYHGVSAKLPHCASTRVKSHLVESWFVKAETGVVLKSSSHIWISQNTNRCPFEMWTNGG